MKSLKISFAIALVISISGCASTRPEDLSKTTLHEEIVLKERISTVSYRGMHVRCEEGALPGAYVATNEDAEGVYYFGKDRSIWMTNEVVQPKPRLLVGGIYVPKTGKIRFDKKCRASRYKSFSNKVFDGINDAPVSKVDIR